MIHFIQRQPELSKTVGQAQIKAGHREGTPPVLELSSVSVAVWESTLSHQGKEFSVFRQHSGTTSVHLQSQIQTNSSISSQFLLPSSHRDVTFGHRPQRIIIHNPATPLSIPHPSPLLPLSSTLHSSLMSSLPPSIASSR